MKNLLAIFVLALMFTACGETTPTDTNTSNTANQGHRYAIEAGTIEYELTGDWIGTQTIYFDDWGNLQADHMEMTMEMFGVTQDVNEANILKDGIMYTLDLNARTGTKMSSEVLNETLTQDSEVTAEMITEELMESFGGTKTGTDEIAGKTCDVWEIESLFTTTCLWNSIALKTTASMAGIEMESIAVKIEEKSPSADKFEIPEDIEITEDPFTEEYDMGMEEYREMQGLPIE